MKNSTIAAIATAQGAGGIAVIRISGSEAISLADKIFKSNIKLEDLSGYQAKYGKLYNKNNEVLDEVVVLVFRAPHSYTGEDIVEISCHGGFFSARNILHEILSLGANLAENGEFTKRAFLNKKIDLTQAEAVIDLISAQGEKSWKSAISAKSGALFKKIEKIKLELLNLSARLAVWSDYPEEDDINLNLQEIQEILNKINKSLKKLINNFSKNKIIKDGLKTAIIGSPNVGKSTLMNLLAEKEKSIVTEVAGTTRDIIEEKIIIENLVLNLIDTAGIRESSDIVEKIGINKSKEQINQADLILAIFDNSRKLNENDLLILNILKNKKDKVINIINKIDLNKKIDINNKDFNNIIEISSVNNTGIKNLKNKILEISGTLDFDFSEGALANERQFIAVKKAQENISEALNALNSGITLDAITILIEYSLNNLYELTGEKASENIINEIFSKFCVGK